MDSRRTDPGFTLRGIAAEKGEDLDGRDPERGRNPLLHCTGPEELHGPRIGDSAKVFPLQTYIERIRR